MSKNLKNNLMPNEKIVEVASFSKALLIPGILITFLFLIANPAALFVAFLSFIPAIIYFTSNTLAVTNKKILGITGLVKKSELESPLNKIQNIKVDYSVLGRLFKYGTVQITTDSGLYTFKYIAKPVDFKKAVMLQIEASEYDKMDVHAEKIASAIKNNK